VPVPVELLDFTGKLVGKNVDLVWRTAAELNNLGFDVERSVNGASFEKIGFVEGRGTITVPQPYYFTDEKASQTQAPVLYYRLRQIDTDGTHAYSNTVPIVMPGAYPTYLLYPNPARDVLMITLNNFVPNKKVELTLLQADGKVQQANSLTPTMMGQQVRMDISRAAEGYYILMAKQQGMTISQKVMVVR